MVKKSQFLSLTKNADALACQEELTTYTYEKVEAVVNCIDIIDGGSSVFE
jgi:hypothetical protein